jgi:hypothetical protein
MGLRLLDSLAALSPVILPITPIIPDYPVPVSSLSAIIPPAIPIIPPLARDDPQRSARVWEPMVIVDTEGVVLPLPEYIFNKS